MHPREWRNDVDPFRQERNESRQRKGPLVFRQLVLIALVCGSNRASLSPLSRVDAISRAADSCVLLLPAAVRLSTLRDAQAGCSGVQR